MGTFKAHKLRKVYKKVQKLGDKLAKADILNNWEAFRPIVSLIYDNMGPNGGRPNVDEAVMVKLLVLQQCARG